MNINAIIHTDIEPGVITASMIKNAFQEQGPDGEAGRLMEEEEYDIHTTSVKNLRLEFLNILRIDHLWMLTGLTKLQLSNNIIEKIENLNELVNLVELDLSFNKIHAIENLDTLTKLEILALYQNKIKVLENIDNLKELEIFTIGNNEISDPECVIYLRKFKNLKALNMAGNPCTAESDFKEYVAAFIPQLVYYEYRLITMDERENGQNSQRLKLQKIQDEEAKELKEEQLAEAREKELSLHREAYVEHLDKDQLYDSFFENDPDGASAQLTGQEAEEIFEGFKTNTCDATRGLFEVGMEQLKLRQEEIRQFNDTVTYTKTESITASRNVVERFLAKKNKLFYETKRLVESVENEQLNDDELGECGETMRSNSDEMHLACHDVWTSLMGNELVLYEQLEELNTSFERNLADMINVFIELAQGFFTQLREHEASFMELITEHLLRYQTQVSLRNEDLSTYPPPLASMLVDKDSVHSAMAASHDLHLLVIDAREDTLVSRIREWHTKLCADMQSNEIERSRRAVAEINHFLDFEREDFELLQNKLSETYLQINDNLMDGNSEQGQESIASIAAPSTNSSE